MQTDKSAHRVELLAKIAGLYFEENLTQDEVALRTGYSRSMISRLLTEARQEGVVEIRVKHPLERNEAAERELAGLFHLKATRVLAAGSMEYAMMLRRLGALAASYLDSIMHMGMSIGVSWGTALWEMTNAVQPRSYTDVLVVGLIGALGTINAEIDGPEIARRLARAFGGRYQNLPAPLIVDHALTQQALIKDPRIETVLEMARNVDIALVGIGTTDPAHASLVRAGYMSEQEILSLHNMGIVGDVCAIHLDSEGRVANIPLNERVIGIRPEDLRKIPVRIGIAGGAAKAAAVMAACRSGLVNVLITDEIAAQAALQRSLERV